MSISEKEIELIEEFDLFDDWMDKYEHIIDQAKSLPIIDSGFKTDDYVVKGCQSKVWLTADFIDGKVFYKADSDAVITKGIVALLIRILSGETPEAILANDLKFIDDIGLKEHLSPNRSNGLVSMIKLMKSYALGFQLKKKQQHL